MAHCSARIGDAYYRTPRNTVKGFIDLLAVIEQNPSIPWSSHIGHAQIDAENPSLAGGSAQGERGTEGSDDDLSVFKL